MGKEKWIEIARTGTFEDSAGRLRTFTAGDLGAIARSYDPARRDAPLTFGHPQTDKAFLRRSIDYAATPEKVMVGSNLPYARIHQLGGKTGKGHKVDMPARPYLGVSKEDMEEVRETMADFLAGAFKA